MERGRIYGSLTARYGEAVDVHGSSSATEPQCWLSINTAEDKNDYMTGKRIEATALMTLPQAIVLRAALDSFISDASDDAA